MFLLKKENNLQEAFVYGNIALSEATNKSDSLELLNHVADFATQIGQFEKAYYLRNEEFRLYRNTIKADALKSTDNSLLKSELFLKEENAKLVGKQKDLQQKFLYGSLIALLMMAILTIIIFQFALQRRRQNRLLKIQNEEKAMLLGEIHHRVKNNLEMLQSMLILQMREYKEDNNVQTALGEANNRIQSIALLHKQLYSGNLARTNANAYFTEMFARIMDDANNRRNFTILHQLRIVYMEMSPDTILPLALLINEWITNSVKYAFPKEQFNPLITLEIQQNENEIALHYADNGENNFANNELGTGFGSRLIHSLVKQLKGKLEISKSEKGWGYALHFPNQ
jgi:two-component sensor histidine kinase